MKKAKINNSWDNIKQNNIHIIGAAKREGKMVQKTYLNK